MDDGGDSELGAVAPFSPVLKRLKERERKLGKQVRSRMHLQ
jgi:hypothetical protein